MVLTEVSSCVAALFVPASRPERFAKAASCGADAVIVDLEDAVASDNKVAARSALRADFSTRPVLVRINAVGSPWHEDDLAAVAGKGFSAVMVPKAERPQDLAAISRTLNVPVIALVETALGLANARLLAAARGVARLAFGSIDFCSDIGCVHSREALLSARVELVLASRLAGLSPPIDGVTTSTNDSELVMNDARYASGLGFGGKLGIHPAQIEPIRLGFVPEASEVEWARIVLASGDGATSVEGLMVDEPVRARARAILGRSMKIERF